MEKKKYVIFCVCFFILLSTYSAETIRYISPNGNDKNTGSYDAPWKTPLFSIQEAVKYLQQHPDRDIKLIFRAGLYPIPYKINIKGKGIKGKLTIEAEKIGKVQFDGGITIDNFQLYERKKSNGKTIYKASLPPSILKMKPFSEEYRTEVYFNNKRLQIARYPNQGFLKTGKILGSTITKDNSKSEGIFKYNDKKLNPLANGEGWLHGFWCYDWSDEFQQVKFIDTKRKIIELVGNHYYGYKEDRRFYALNSLDFLDEPLEYYIDRKTSILYWMPPSNIPKEDLKLSIPIIENDCMIEISNFNGFSLNGMVLCNGNNRAIDINNGVDNIIKNCNILQFASDAIHINNGQNNIVENCLIENIGGKGIQAIGGDRKTLTPSGFIIRNNIFRNLSFYKFTYQQGINFRGCGVSISKNEFSDMPSSAIRIEGNDATIEYNYFHDLVLMSDDQGAFEMYQDPSYRGVVVRNNLWQDIRDKENKRMVAAIRLDDMICGQKVYNNTFVNCGSGKFGAVQIFGGKDNQIFKNTFYQCNYAVSFTQYGVMWENELKTDKLQILLYQDVNIKSNTYTRKYPELLDGMFSNVDRNFVFDNNIYNCANGFLNIDKNVMRNNKIQQLSVVPEINRSAGTENNPYKIE